MIKKYGIFGFSALALLAIGCGDSSTGSGTTLQTYPSEINEEAKTISITLPSCEQISETEVRFDPEGNNATLEYDLSDGSLFIDDGFDVTEYTGNNSSLYGTWTMADEECEENGLCETLKITSTSVSRSVDMSGICAIDYMVASMFADESLDGEAEIPEYTKTSCTSGSINMDGVTLDIKIDKFTETGTDVTLTIDGEKCRMYMNAKPLTSSLCTIENIENIEGDMYMENNMEDFMGCYLAIIMQGFEDFENMEDYEDFTLEKAKKLKNMSKIFSAK